MGILEERLSQFPAKLESRGQWYSWKKDLQQYLQGVPILHLYEYITAGEVIHYGAAEEEPTVSEMNSAGWSVLNMTVDPYVLDTLYDDGEKFPIAHEMYLALQKHYGKLSIYDHMELAQKWENAKINNQDDLKKVRDIAFNLYKGQLPDTFGIQMVAKVHPKFRKNIRDSIIRKFRDTDSELRVPYYDVRLIILREIPEH